MVILAIPQNRAEEISRQTVTLTTETLERIGAKPIDLLPKAGQGIHAKLKDFADTVVLIEQSKKWGTPDYLDRYTACTLPLFQPLDVSQVYGQGEDLGGYGSWLYQAKFRGTFYVVFDGVEIARLCRRLRKNADEVQVKLYLHELGHFVLHREELFAGKGTMQEAMNAEAEMEVESWLFAYVVMGLCVGDYAYQSKNLFSPDDSWRIW